MTEHIHEWLVCPDCGHDDFDYIPTRPPGQNNYLRCPDCDKEAVIVG